MSAFSFNKLVIFGVGLIGGSLGLALKKHKFQGKIIGCDSAGVMDRARSRGAIDDAIALPADAVRGSEIGTLVSRGSGQRLKGLRAGM